MKEKERERVCEKSCVCAEKEGEEGSEEKVKMKEEMQGKSKSMRKYCEELGSLKRILKPFGERLRALQYKRREVI